ncbi:hypothetical protein Pelo_4845 [Pelomyxa schiedti]|nr:hypothetical protein Pelo_4845 [Pelomyxa schiedti]
MSMYVRVKREQQCIFIMCDPTDLVGSIKAKVGAVLKMSPDKLRLFSNPTTPLDETRTVADSKIAYDAVLHLACKNEGS